MNSTNFFRMVHFLQARNFVSSVFFGMGAAGVENLIRDLNRLSTGDMLSMIKMRSKLSDQAFADAVKLFLRSSENLSQASTKQQRDIVMSLGLQSVYKMFADENSVKEIFAQASKGERNTHLLDGLISYYQEMVKPERWKSSPEVMEFLADAFVNYPSIHAYAMSPKLTTFVVDCYGLEIAASPDYTKAHEYDFSRFINALDYASEQGIVDFFTNSPVRITLKMDKLQNLLLIQNKATLQTVVATVGCSSADVERNLLFNGGLPESSIKKNFCFPQNFTMLMDSFDKSKHESFSKSIAELFPEDYKRKYQYLWEWVLTNRLPAEAIKHEKCSEFEWSFLLADDKLCRHYIAQNGEFTDQDIATLLQLGKDNIIHEYRNKK